MRLASRSGVNLELLLAEALKAVAGAPAPGRRLLARMAVKF